MWNIQEQEERDYQAGMANEFQNALAWSSMNRKPDDSARAQAQLDAGRFVVVLDGPEYCPVTDAIMGSRRVLDSSHDTREAAEARLREIGDMDEVCPKILPRRPDPARYQL